jgi:DNA-binding PadR family transcriptional regulator
VADTTVREPTYLILLALAGGRLHGYGVIRTVLELSGGRVTLRPGTVYGEEIEQGRVRRYYEITEAGSAVLVAETERMASNVTAARRQLGRRNHSLGVEGA